MENYLTDTIPIAKSFSLFELTGWLGKRFHVPKGKLGVLLDPDGNSQTFLPGLRPVISPFARLSGKGLGMRLGYVPAEPFLLPSRNDNLLTGDDELLDASLLLQLDVTDPILFFRNIVVPVGELRELPDLELNQIRGEIEKVMSQYEREDILKNIQAAHLADEIKGKILQYFNQMGLKLISIPTLFFKKSEDRLLAAEKLTEYETKLRENHKSDNDFAQGNDISMQDMPGAISLRSGERKPFSEVFKDIQRFKTLENAPKQHWLLKSIQTPKMDAVDQTVLIALKKWRFLELRWIFALVFVGGLVAFLVHRFKLDLKSAEVIASLVGIFAMLISYMLVSMKKMVEKNELLISHKGNLKDLEGGHVVSHADRAEVDRLLRQRCGNELLRVQEILFETRGEIYRSGDTDLAMKIKELERKIEEHKNKILTPGFGTPVYLTDVSVTEVEWNRFLDEEERVLLLAKSVGVISEKLRATIPDTKIEDIQRLEKQLQVFETGFFSRSRLV